MKFNIRLHRIGLRRRFVRNGIKRGVALLLVFILAVPEAWSLPMRSSPAPAPDVATATAPAMPAVMGIYAGLPYSLRDLHPVAFYPGSKSLVIYLQDPHACIGAQESMARGLSGWIDKLGVRRVFVEGGWGDCSLGAFRRAKGDDFWKTRARGMMLDGRLAGEEYLNLTGSQDFSITGIEDKALYARSVGLFARIRERRDKVTAFLNRSEAFAEAILFRRLDEKTRRFFTALDQSQNQEPLARWRLVKNEMPRAGVALEQRSLLKRIEKIWSITGTQYETQQPKNDLESSTQKTAKEFRIVSPKWLMARTPRLLKELKDAEGRTVRALLSDPDASLAWRIRRYTRLLKQAAHLGLMPEEVVSMRDDALTMPSVSWQAWINRKLREFGSNDRLLAEEALEPFLADVLWFYRLTGRRDRAFARNFLSYLNNPSTNTTVDNAPTVLITGGHHTADVVRHLTAAGHPVAVFSPTVEFEGDPQQYEARLLEGLSTRTGHQNRMGTTPQISSTSADLRKLAAALNPAFAAAVFPTMMTRVNPDDKRPVFTAARMAESKRRIRRTRGEWEAVLKALAKKLIPGKVATPSNLAAVSEGQFDVHAIKNALVSHHINRTELGLISFKSEREWIKILLKLKGRLKAGEAATPMTLSAVSEGVYSNDQISRAMRRLGDKSIKLGLTTTKRGPADRLKIFADLKSKLEKGKPATVLNLAEASGGEYSSNELYVCLAVDGAEFYRQIGIVTRPPVIFDERDARIKSAVALLLKKYGRAPDLKETSLVVFGGEAATNRLFEWLKLNGKKPSDYGIVAKAGQRKEAVAKSGMFRYAGCVFSIPKSIMNSVRLITRGGTSKYGRLLISDYDHPDNMLILSYQNGAIRLIHRIGGISLSAQEIPHFKKEFYNLEVQEAFQSFYDTHFDIPLEPGPQRELAVYRHVRDDLMAKPASAGKVFGFGGVFWVPEVFIEGPNKVEIYRDGHKRNSANRWLFMVNDQRPEWWTGLEKTSNGIVDMRTGSPLPAVFKSQRNKPTPQYQLKNSYGFNRLASSMGILRAGGKVQVYFWPQSMIKKPVHIAYHEDPWTEMARAIGVSRERLIDIHTTIPNASWAPLAAKYGIGAPYPDVDDNERFDLFGAVHGYSTVVTMLSAEAAAVRRLQMNVDGVSEAAGDLRIAVEKLSPEAMLNLPEGLRSRLLKHYGIGVFRSLSEDGQLTDNDKKSIRRILRKVQIVKETVESAPASREMVEHWENVGGEDRMIAGETTASPDEINANDELLTLLAEAIKRLPKEEADIIRRLMTLAERDPDFKLDNLEEITSRLGVEVSVIGKIFSDIRNHIEPESSVEGARMAEDGITFKKYLNIHHLDQYRNLIPLISSAVQKILVEDASLRPVFLVKLPQDAVGPIQVTYPELVERMGGEQWLDSYSGFLAGNADQANRLAGEGYQILVGVVDRPASDFDQIIGDQNFRVAHGRATLFPLEDGTWLCVKGSGQYTDEDRPPFYFNSEGEKYIGLVPLHDVVGGANSEKTMNIVQGAAGSSGLFNEFLGYRKILRMPDGRGGWIDATALRQVKGGNVEPALVFMRTIEPHRLLKLPQILLTDPGLESTTRRIGETLRRQGLILETQPFEPSDLIKYFVRNCARSEAMKINLGLARSSLHTQDINLIGQEASDSWVPMTDKTHWAGVQAKYFILFLIKYIQERNDQYHLMPRPFEVFELFWRTIFESLDIERFEELLDVSEGGGSDEKILLDRLGMGWWVRHEIFHASGYDPSSNSLSGENQVRQKQMMQWVAREANKIYQSRISGARMAARREGGFPGEVKAALKRLRGSASVARVLGALKILEHDLQSQAGTMEFERWKRLLQALVKKNLQTRKVAIKGNSTNAILELLTTRKETITSAQRARETQDTVLRASLRALIRNQKTHWNLRVEAMDYLRSAGLGTRSGIGALTTASKRKSEPSVKAAAARWLANIRLARRRKTDKNNLPTAAARMALVKPAHIVSIYNRLRDERAWEDERFGRFLSDMDNYAEARTAEKGLNNPRSFVAADLRADLDVVMAGHADSQSRKILEALFIAANTLIAQKNPSIRVSVSASEQAEILRIAKGKLNYLTREFLQGQYLLQILRSIESGQIILAIDLITEQMRQFGADYQNALGREGFDPSHLSDFFQIYATYRTILALLRMIPPKPDEIRRLVGVELARYDSPERKAPTVLSQADVDANRRSVMAEITTDLIVDARLSELRKKSLEAEYRKLVREYLAAERMVHRVNHTYVTPDQLRALFKDTGGVLLCSQMMRDLFPNQMVGHGETGTWTAFDDYLDTSQTVSMSLEAPFTMSGPTDSGFADTGILLIYKPQAKEIQRILAFDMTDIAQYTGPFEVDGDEAARTILSMSSLREVREESAVARGLNYYRHQHFSHSSHLGPLTPREIRVPEGIGPSYLEKIVVRDEFFNAVRGMLGEKSPLRDRVVRSSEYFAQDESGAYRNPGLEHARQLLAKIKAIEATLPQAAARMASSRAMDGKSAGDLVKSIDNLGQGGIGQVSQRLSNEPLIDGDDFTKLNNGGFGQPRGLEIGALYGVVAGGQLPRDVGSNRGNNNVLLGGVEAIGGNDKSRTLLEGGKVGEWKRDQDNVTLAIAGHTPSRPDYSRNQTTVQMPSAKPGQWFEVLKDAAGRLRDVFGPLHLLQRSPVQFVSESLSVPPASKDTRREAINQAAARMASPGKRGRKADAAAAAIQAKSVDIGKALRKKGSRYLFWRLGIVLSVVIGYACAKYFLSGSLGWGYPRHQSIEHVADNTANDAEIIRRSGVWAQEWLRAFDSADIASGAGYFEPIIYGNALVARRAGDSGFIKNMNSTSHVITLAFNPDILKREFDLAATMPPKAGEALLASIYYREMRGWKLMQDYASTFDGVKKEFDAFQKQFIAYGNNTALKTQFLISSEADLRRWVVTYYAPEYIETMAQMSFLKRAQERGKFVPRDAEAYFEAHPEDKNTYLHSIPFGYKMYYGSADSAEFTGRAFSSIASTWLAHSGDGGVEALMHYYLMMLAHKGGQKLPGDTFDPVLGNALLTKQIPPDPKYFYEMGRQLYHDIRNAARAWLEPLEDPGKKAPQGARMAKPSGAQDGLSAFLNDVLEPHAVEGRDYGDWKRIYHQFLEFDKWSDDPELGRIEREVRQAALEQYKMTVAQSVQWETALDGPTRYAKSDVNKVTVRLIGHHRSLLARVFRRIQGRMADYRSDGGPVNAETFISPYLGTEAYAERLRQLYLQSMRDKGYDHVFFPENVGFPSKEAVDQRDVTSGLPVTPFLVLRQAGFEPAVRGEVELAKAIVDNGFVGVDLIPESASGSPGIILHFNTPVQDEWAGYKFTSIACLVLTEAWPQFWDGDESDRNKVERNAALSPLTFSASDPENEIKWNIRRQILDLAVEGRLVARGEAYEVLSDEGAERLGRFFGRNDLEARGITAEFTAGLRDLGVHGKEFFGAIYAPRIKASKELRQKLIEQFEKKRRDELRDITERAEKAARALKIMELLGLSSEDADIRERVSRVKPMVAELAMLPEMRPVFMMALGKDSGGHWLLDADASERLLGRIGDHKLKLKEALSGSARAAVPVRARAAAAVRIYDALTEGLPQPERFVNPRMRLMRFAETQFGLAEDSLTALLGAPAVDTAETADPWSGLNKEIAEQIDLFWLFFFEPVDKPVLADLRAQGDAITQIVRKAAALMDKELKVPDPAPQLNLRGKTMDLSNSLVNLDRWAIRMGDSAVKEPPAASAPAWIDAAIRVREVAESKTHDVDAFLHAVKSLSVYSAYQMHFSPERQGAMAAEIIRLKNARDDQAVGVSQGTDAGLNAPANNMTERASAYISQDSPLATAAERILTKPDYQTILTERKSRSIREFLEAVSDDRDVTPTDLREIRRLVDIAWRHAQSNEKLRSFFYDVDALLRDMPATTPPTTKTGGARMAVRAVFVPNADSRVDMTVRKVVNPQEDLTPDELDDAMALLKKSYEHSGHVFNREAFIVEMTPSATRSQARLYLAMVGQTTVGVYCVLMGSGSRPPVAHMAWGNGIFIKTDKRKKGYGLALMESVLRDLKSEGIKNFRINSATNLAPRKLQAKFIARYQNAEPPVIAHIFRRAKDGSVLEYQIDPSNLPDTIPPDPIPAAARMADGARASEQKATWDSIAHQTGTLPNSVVVYPAANTDIKTIRDVVDAYEGVNEIVFVDGRVYDNPYFKQDIIRELRDQGFEADEADLQRWLDAPRDSVGPFEVNLKVVGSKSGRTVKLKMFNQGYFDWSAQAAGYPQGFGLTVIKRPGDDAEFSRPPYADRFYDKVFGEAANGGWVWVTEAAHPSNPILDRVGAAKKSDTDLYKLYQKSAARMAESKGKVGSADSMRTWLNVIGFGVFVAAMFAAVPVYAAFFGTSWIRAWWVLVQPTMIGGILFILFHGMLDAVLIMPSEITARATAEKIKADILKTAVEKKDHRLVRGLMSTGITIVSAGWEDLSHVYHPGVKDGNILIPGLMCMDLPVFREMVSYLIIRRALGTEFNRVTFEAMSTAHLDPVENDLIRSQISYAIWAFMGWGDYETLKRFRYYPIMIPYLVSHPIFSYIAYALAPISMTAHLLQKTTWRVIGRILKDILRPSRSIDPGNGTALSIGDTPQSVSTQTPPLIGARMAFAKYKEKTIVQTPWKTGLYTKKQILEKLTLYLGDLYEPQYRWTMPSGYNPWRLMKSLRALAPKKLVEVRENFAGLVSQKSGLREKLANLNMDPFSDQNIYTRQRYMKAFELADLVGDMSLHEFDRNADIRELREVLGGRKIRAHGTRGFGFDHPSNAIQLHHYWALLNIMLEGASTDGSSATILNASEAQRDRLTMDERGRLSGMNASYIDPFQYGPCMLVYKSADHRRYSRIMSFGKVDQRDHAIYLVPNQASKDWIQKAMRKALEIGLIDRNRYLASLAKLMTYDEVITSRSQIDKIISGKITPASALHSAARMADSAGGSLAGDEPIVAEHTLEDFYRNMEESKRMVMVPGQTIVFKNSSGHGEEYGLILKNNGNDVVVSPTYGGPDVSVTNSSVIHMHRGKAIRRLKADGSEVAVLYRVIRVDDRDEYFESLKRWRGLPSFGLKKIDGDKKALRELLAKRFNIQPDDIARLLMANYGLSDDHSAYLLDGDAKVSPVLSFTADPYFAEGWVSSGHRYNAVIELEVPVDRILELPDADRVDGLKHIQAVVLKQPNQYDFIRSPYGAESEYTSIADPVPAQYVKKIYMNDANRSQGAKVIPQTSASSGQTDVGAAARMAEGSLARYVQSVSKVSSIHTIKVDQSSPEFAAAGAVAAMMRGESVMLDLSGLPGDTTVEHYGKIADWLRRFSMQLAELVGKSAETALMKGGNLFRNGAYYTLYLKLREALKNAFVHGNAMDQKQPIYLKADFDKKHLIKKIEIFDVHTDQKASPEALAAARDKKVMLWGSGKGVSTILMPGADRAGGWTYARTPIVVVGQKVGQRVSIALSESFWLHSAARMAGGLVADWRDEASATNSLTYPNRFPVIYRTLKEMALGRSADEPIEVATYGPGGMYDQAEGTVHSPQLVEALAVPNSVVTVIGDDLVNRMRTADLVYRILPPGMSPGEELYDGIRALWRDRQRSVTSVGAGVARLVDVRQRISKSFVANFEDLDGIYRGLGFEKDQPKRVFDAVIATYSLAYGFEGKTAEEVMKYFRLLTGSIKPGGVVIMDSTTAMLFAKGVLSVMAAQGLLDKAKIGPKLDLLSDALLQKWLNDPKVASLVSDVRPPRFHVEYERDWRKFGADDAVIIKRLPDTLDAGGTAGDSNHVAAEATAARMADATTEQPLNDEVLKDAANRIAGSLDAVLEKSRVSFQANDEETYRTAAQEMEEINRESRKLGLYGSPDIYDIGNPSLVLRNIGWIDLTSESSKASFENSYRRLKIYIRMLRRYAKSVGPTVYYLKDPRGVALPFTARELRQVLQLKHGGWERSRYEQIMAYYKEIGIEPMKSGRSAARMADGLARVAFVADGLDAQSGISRDIRFLDDMQSGMEKIMRTRPGVGSGNEYDRHRPVERLDALRREGMLTRVFIEIIKQHSFVSGHGRMWSSKKNVARDIVRECLKRALNTPLLTDESGPSANNGSIANIFYYYSNFIQKVIMFNSDLAGLILGEMAELPLPDRDYDPVRMELDESAGPEARGLLERFKDPVEFRRFLAALTLARGAVKSDQRSESAFQSDGWPKVVFQYGPYWVSPAKDTFRRDLIGIPQPGGAMRWLEIKIPGAESEDKELVQKTHFTVVTDLRRSEALKDHIVPVLGYVETTGQADIYGRSRPFYEEKKLRMVLFEYHDGFRIDTPWIFVGSIHRGGDNLIFDRREQFRCLAERHGRTVEEFREEKALEVIRTAKAILYRGYVGRYERASDWHLGNVRLIHEDGRVEWVSDTGAFGPASLTDKQKKTEIEALFRDNFGRDKLVIPEERFEDLYQKALGLPAAARMAVGLAGVAGRGDLARVAEEARGDEVIGRLPEGARLAVQAGNAAAFVTVRGLGAGGLRQFSVDSRPYHLTVGSRLSSDTSRRDERSARPIGEVGLSQVIAHAVQLIRRNTRSAEAVSTRSVEVVVERVDLDYWLGDAVGDDLIKGSGLIFDQLERIRMRGWQVEYSVSDDLKARLLAITASDRAIEVIHQINEILSLAVDRPGMGRPQESQVVAVLGPDHPLVQDATRYAAKREVMARDAYGKPVAYLLLGARRPDEEWTLADLEATSLSARVLGIQPADRVPDREVIEFFSPLFGGSANPADLLAFRQGMTGSRFLRLKNSFLRLFRWTDRVLHDSLLSKQMSDTSV